MAKKRSKVDGVVWLNRGWQPSAIGFIPSRKAWKREMKRIGRVEEPYPHDGKATAAYCQWVTNRTSGDSIIYITINEKLIGDDPVGVVASLVHEASHAVDWVFEHTGQKACTETRAYAMECVTAGLLNAYSETLGKGKKWP